jgi:hypothetical protein
MFLLFFIFFINLFLPLLLLLVVVFLYVAKKWQFDPQEDLAKIFVTS